MERPQATSWGVGRRWHYSPTFFICYIDRQLMVGVAQLVRASGCEPESHGFNPRRSPLPLWIRTHTGAATTVVDSYLKTNGLFLTKYSSQGFVRLPIQVTTHITATALCGLSVSPASWSTTHLTEYGNAAWHWNNIKYEDGYDDSPKDRANWRS